MKAFYTAGILFDILTNFSKELSEDFAKMRKYAKWRAAYIHNCLKNGEKPEVPQDTSYDYDEGAQDMLGPVDQFSVQGPSGESSNNSGNVTGWAFPAAPQSQPSVPSFPEVNPESTGITAPPAPSASSSYSIPQPATNSYGNVFSIVILLKNVSVIIDVMSVNRCPTCRIARCYYAKRGENNKGTEILQMGRLCFKLRRCTHSCT